MECFFKNNFIKLCLALLLFNRRYPSKSAISQARRWSIDFSLKNHHSTSLESIAIDNKDIAFLLLYAIRLGLGTPACLAWGTPYLAAAAAPCRVADAAPTSSWCLMTFNGLLFFSIAHRSELWKIPIRNPRPLNGKPSSSFFKVSKCQKGWI